MKSSAISDSAAAVDLSRARAVLFVCSGNICRSPSAEGVFRKMADAHPAAPLGLRIESAGLNGYHIGEAPDPRAQAAARARGYDLSSLRARAVAAEDFDAFDWVLAMDRGHERALARMAGAARRRGVKMFLDFADGVEREVADPYYGDAADFERMMDAIEAGCRGLLRALTESAGAG